MAATIRDVSKRAGVSSATVSRAFSNPEKLTSETLEKVQVAAKELNYKPNHLSTIFRSRQTKTVLVMVPDLSNAFFGPVLRGMEKISGEHGYSLLLSDTQDNPELERGCITMVESRRADGIIQLGARSLGDLGGDQTGVAFVHAIEADLDSGQPSVRIDNIHASAKIVKYMIGQGHSRIALIGGQRESKITVQRRKGFLEALGDAGLPADPACEEYSDYSLAGGEKAGAALLERCPDVTAVFCMSDEIAIGAMRAAKARGLELPRDLSVAGFDNIAFGSYCEPPLTSVMQPAERIGEIAVSVLMARLAGEDVSAMHYVLPTELIIRESVVPPQE